VESLAPLFSALCLLLNKDDRISDALSLKVVHCASIVTRLLSVMDSNCQGNSAWTMDMAWNFEYVLCSLFPRSSINSDCEYRGQVFVVSMATLAMQSPETSDVSTIVLRSNLYAKGVLHFSELGVVVSLRPRQIHIRGAVATRDILNIEKLLGLERDVGRLPEFSLAHVNHGGEVAVTIRFGEHASSGGHSDALDARRRASITMEFPDDLKDKVTEFVVRFSAMASEERTGACTMYLKNQDGERVFHVVQDAGPKEPETVFADWLAAHLKQEGLLLDAQRDRRAILKQNQEEARGSRRRSRSAPRRK